jgi:hypothetical protein
MAIRIRIVQTRPKQQVFTHEIGVGKPAFRSLAFSVLLHGVALAGLAAIPRPAPTREIVHRPALLPTEIRIDDHLYYVAELTRDETTAEETQEDQSSPAQTAASQAAARKRRARKKNTATAAKPGEVLPPLAAAELRGPSATQVLIQPGLPPALTTPALTLPTFRVWTDQAPLVRKAFVTPGRQNPAPPGSPPQLDPPDLDLVHADPALAQNQAKLVLPRPPSPLEPTPNASAGPQPIPVGDPVNVLSVSDRPKAANERLVVPPVQMGASGVDNVQPGARGQGGGATGAGRGPATQTAAPSQTASNVNSVVNPPVNPVANPVVNPGVKSPAPDPSNPAAPNSAPPGRSSPNAPQATQPAVNQPGVAQPGVTQPGTGVPAVVGPRPSSSQPPGTARIEMPRNGNYEVVVTQNAGVIPGSAEFLRGRPVYSVYLHAGDKKDWILQYCLPASDEAPRKNSVVIRLSDPAQVGGPYAVVMLRPAVTFAAPDIRYAMVHGFINKDGHFEQLSEVGDRALKNMPELLQALAAWEFRPATKDGAPVMVEVLLCIPNIRT